MVTLIILDGFGIRKEKKGNAIKCAGTPNLKKLFKHFPHTALEASGEAVGLPAGVMGNSETGHLTIGNGRVILQDLQLIDTEIANGNFFKNKALIKAMKHAEKNGSNLHIMGILSDGRIHADIAHLFAILDHSKKYKIKNIYLHVFTDGRDTGIKDAPKYIKMTEEKISGTNIKIGTLVGRELLDRAGQYEKVEKLYNLLVHGKGEKVGSAMEAVEKSYAAGIYDEVIEPFVIDKNAKIKDNDSVIFYHYRSDREHEITSAFGDPNFKEFKTKKFKNFLFTPMTEYLPTLKHLNTIYPPVQVKSGLSETLSKKGLKQFHIAETTKYAHVTFFFNGGIEKPFKGEDRFLIDSIDTPDFSPYPKMRALEITEKTLEAIKSKKYDFILVNYSNPDMIGHTGNFEAAKEAIKCVDKEAFTLAKATLDAGGECIITADHGNAELMIDEEGEPVRTHTTNPVPFILVSNKNKKVKLKKKQSIASVAPTILKLLNQAIPSSMEKPLF